ncbi:GNAT family N-acetyltransferase [Streptomyces europaeiscabiei]|uniref:GNAT family N-acetyltransferase n=1 Tax=Streptomyces europaeiscabiei TaxID=146819 RepID=UPI0029ACD3C3|nr:GNAT family N-acetyltransferase [Streptomyces europaeiscabiei]MDX3698108.1 GNAT family N-acetyltransferase [Streptomyces europaeiscabiei]
MTLDPLIARAHALWQDLAGAPVEFGRSAASVIVSPRSQLCPPSWCGVVVLDGAGIITVPTAEAAVQLRNVAAAVPPAALVQTDVLRAELPVAEVLGPAALAYLSSPDFRPMPTGRTVTRVPAEHPGLLALLTKAGQEDADESGLDEISSPAFVVLDGVEVVAAAGYRAWPGRTAHLSVLTVPEHRSRGLAKTVASAAVAHALDAGLMPQWRARPESSRRVAHALGFQEVGAQLSIRLDDGEG